MSLIVVIACLCQRICLSVLWSYMWPHIPSVTALPRPEDQTGAAARPAPGTRSVLGLLIGQSRSYGRPDWSIPQSRHPIGAPNAVPGQSCVLRFLIGLFHVPRLLIGWSGWLSNRQIISTRASWLYLENQNASVVFWPCRIVSQLISDSVLILP